MSYVWGFVVVAVIFIALERLFPAKTDLLFSWRRYRTDILHALVGGLLVSLGYAGVMVALTQLIGVSGSAWQLPLWLQCVAVLLICDLGVWVAHRLFHAVPMLWRFHRIHHSSERLDWLAAYRFHPVDHITMSVISMLPVALLGFSPVAVAIYGAIYQWHAVLLHSNVRVSLGRLGRIVSTPQFHHWHHANEAEAYDRNFGAQLIIWDVLFRTAIFAKSPRPDRYGVDRAPVEGFASHLISPFLPDNISNEKRQLIAVDAN